MICGNVTGDFREPNVAGGSTATCLWVSRLSQDWVACTDVSVFFFFFLQRVGVGIVGHAVSWSVLLSLPV
jgi:hypothetical protein